MTPTTPKLPEPATGAMKIVAWRYKTPHTTHLCHVQLDHYFSIDEGKTYIKGDPLVRLSDAQALAGEVERLRAEVAAKDAENERLSHQWCEIRQDREMVADAVRRLLQAPGDPNVAALARLAIGEPSNG